MKKPYIHPGVTAVALHLSVLLSGSEPPVISIDDEKEANPEEEIL